MENSSESGPALQKNTSSGLLHDLGWFASGAILPLGSLSFYRTAVKRTVGLAILFFFVFTIFISALTTIGVGVSMLQAVTSIRQAYQKGQIPDIAIRGGMAEVEGPQPFVALNEQSSQGAVFVAADTSGRITSIDQSLYRSGFLLTRTELHMLSNGRYQRVALSDINDGFKKDPIVLNEETVASAWVAFSAILAVLVFIGLVLWNSVVRLMIIAVLALILWGIGSLLRPRIGFGPFIITGLYAIVPAIYISHLLTRSQASFPGVQTILLLLFWVVGLVAALSNYQFLAVDGTPRLWTALLGIPMLILFIVDMFAKLPSPGGLLALWSVFLLTVLAIIGLRLYFHLAGMRPTPPPPAEPAAPPSPTPPQAAP